MSFVLASFGILTALSGLQNLPIVLFGPSQARVVKIRPEGSIAPTTYIQYSSATKMIVQRDQRRDCLLVCVMVRSCMDALHRLFDGP